MDYMTLKEASEKWGVTTRWINYLCTAGRIPGAVKMGTVWLIPKGSEKPADRRRKKPQSLFLWDLGFRTTSARLKSKSLRKK